MSLQFSAGEGEEEEAALETVETAAAQWEESLEHLKHELSQCDEETKVRVEGRNKESGREEGKASR